MIYVALVKLNPWATVEQQFSTEKEAHVWAFEQEGVLITISVLEADFAENLSKKIIAVYKPNTIDNRN